MVIDYEIVYSRRKTIGITVERDRRVVVFAPFRASKQAVSDAVGRRRLWIWQKLRDPRKYAEPTPHKEYVGGETFLFLGQQYSLALTSSERGAVQLVGQQFEMARSDRMSGDQLFRAWYLERAKMDLPPRVVRFAEAMGVSFNRICVRDLKYCWSSCSPKRALTFNWRIIQAPMVVVDYLIVHELAHVLERNHSKSFWNVVSVHVPGSVRARNWLKRNGSRLEW
jgi:predicted metal-dependent hydrolase